MKKIIQTAGKNQLGEFAPEFAHYNDDVLFGENWNNQDLDSVDWDYVEDNYEKVQQVTSYPLYNDVADSIIKIHDELLLMENGSFLATSKY